MSANTSAYLAALDGLFAKVLPAAELLSAFDPGAEPGRRQSRQDVTGMATASNFYA